VGTIVGVVPDVVTNVGALEPLAIYYSMSQQSPTLSRTVVMRAANGADAAVAAATQAIRELNSAIAPAPFVTMEERIMQQMEPQRFGALVLGVLGGIAVLLSILGVYVLAESMAAMRQREIGIRSALGATRGSLNRLLLLETLKLVGAGLAAGLFVAWLGAGTIRAFLFQIRPLDPLTLIAVSLAILAVSLGVSLRPALRSSRVNLAQILRAD
jgi:ABC-type antimicrobial peptide transport system permease subunit